MGATADSIIERRRLRRRVAFWRILAILAILVAVLALIPWGGGRERSEHVAQITVSGLIVDEDERLEAIRRVRDRDEARALVVRIDSPGGTVAGSEALYDALRSVAEKKPVVAVIGEIAASGGYIAALGADRILSRRNAITGSIGVVSQVPNVTELLDRLGISYREVKSSPLKAEPNPFATPSEEAFGALEALILDSYRWFTDLVAERRGLEGAALETVVDGRVFTGHQALELGLIDALGDIEDARDWLAQTRGVSADLPLREYRWGDRDLPFPFDRVEQSLRAFLPAAPLGVVPGPRLLALYTG